MKQKWMTTLVVVVIAMLSVIVISSCSSPTPTATPMPTPTEPSRITPLPALTATPTGPRDGESIMTMNCTGCHTTERIQISKKTRDQWEQTVSRMIRLSPADNTALLDYLAVKYKP